MPIARALLAPVFWVGRIALWIFLFPIGVWRSMVHHRKKAQRRTMKQVREETAAATRAMRQEVERELSNRG